MKAIKFKNSPHICTCGEEGQARVCVHNFKYNFESMPKGDGFRSELLMEHANRLYNDFIFVGFTLYSLFIHERRFMPVLMYFLFKQYISKGLCQVITIICRQIIL